MRIYHLLNWIGEDRAPRLAKAVSQGGIHRDLIGFNWMELVPGAFKVVIPGDSHGDELDATGDLMRARSVPPTDTWQGSGAYVLF